MNKLLKTLKLAHDGIQDERGRLARLADKLEEAIDDIEGEEREKAQTIIRKALNVTDQTTAEDRLAEAKRFLQKSKVRYAVTARESDSTENTSLSYYWSISLRVGPRTTRRINREVPKDVLDTLGTLCDEDDVIKRYDREFGVEVTTYVFRFDREEKVSRRRVEQAHNVAIKADRERTRMVRGYSQP